MGAETVQIMPRVRPRALDPDGAGPYGPGLWYHPPAMHALLAAVSTWRLVLGVVCLGFGLLAVLHAPVYPLFLCAVVATEWGHFLAIVSLSLLVGWQRARFGVPGALLGSVAFLLLISPLFRATLRAASVDEDLKAAFGDAPPRAPQGAPARPKPLVFGDLLFGAASAPVTRTTEVYATPAGVPLSADIYRPNSPPPHLPIVLVVHGGSWRGGDRAEPAALNRYLAAHGYLVVSIDYRLAPRFRFPAGPEDVAAAVAWIKKEAGRLGADASNIVLLGRSAGAHLALLEAYTAHDPAIRGVIDFYGPNDLTFAWDHPSNPLVLDTPGLLTDFLGGSPQKFPEQYAKSSALDAAGKSSPPTLLLHGGRDEMVWVKQAERLEPKLRAAGVRVYSLVLPWATHGFDYNFSGPGGQISTYAVERFLAAVTR